MLHEHLTSYFQLAALHQSYYCWDKLVAPSEDFGLSGMSLIVETNVVKDSRRAKKLKILAFIVDSDRRAD